MTSGGRAYPTRVSCDFAGKTGHIVLDQIRAIDKSRCLRKLGRVEEPIATTVLTVLQEMFAF